jgi:hypothetical protein
MTGFVLEGQIWGILCDFYKILGKCKHFLLVSKNFIKFKFK